MPRWFVYVNTNPDRKHIKIHPERERPCGFIAQHIRAGGVYADDFPIQYDGNDVFITGNTANGYWVIVWAESLTAVIGNRYLNRVADELQITIDTCICSQN